MSKKPTSHFEWIDILRGLSALAVVLYHVRVDLWCGWKEIRAHPAAYSAFDRACAFLSVPTPFFGSAVMLFFLLSGFCVHFPHAAEGRPVVLATYLRRRFLRIYPPFLASVVLTLGVESLLWLCFKVPHSAPTTILKSFFMVQNYGDPVGQMSANPSLWSLPVEFELYLAYPLFWVVLLRYGLRTSLALVAIVTASALGLFWMRGGNSQAFHPDLNFAVYWIIWCGGAALAEKAKSGTLAVWRPQYWFLGSLALVAALFAQSRDASLNIQHLLWAAVYIAPLWWGLSQPRALQGIPTSAKKALLFIGTISYSLYLVHFPFFRLCGQIWVALQGHKPTNFLVAVCFCALSIPVGYLFYLLVEVPSHRISRAQNRSRVPLNTELHSNEKSGQPVL